MLIISLTEMFSYLYIIHLCLSISRSVDGGPCKMVLRCPVLRFPLPRFQRISNSIDKAPPDDATVCTECTTQLCVAAGNDPVESPPPSRDILPVPIPSPFYHTTATLYSTLGSYSLTTYNSPETASSLQADFNTADDNDASIPYNCRILSRTFPCLSPNIGLQYSMLLSFREDRLCVCP